MGYFTGSGSGGGSGGGPSPLDFGAAGNGTSDDTAAINALIAAVPAGGSMRLTVPGKTFKTGGGHVLTRSVTVGGGGRIDKFYGAGQLVLANGANSDLLTVASPECTIRDFSYDGNKANQSGTSRGIVTSSTIAANYLALDNIYATSCHDDNILFQHPATSLGAICRAIESRLAGGYPLNLQPGAADCQFSDCEFDQGAQSGVLVRAASTVFQSCHAWGNGTSGSGNCDGWTLADLNASGSRFENCYGESQANGRGISPATNGVKNISIVGGEWWKNYLQGIYAFSAIGWIISGNRVYQNNQHGSTDYTGGGLLLDGACVGVASSGNVLGSDVSPGQSYGLAVNGTGHSLCRSTGDVAPDAWATQAGILNPGGSGVVVV